MGINAGSAVYKLIDTLPPNEQDMVVGGNAAEVFRVDTHVAPRLKIPKLKMKASDYMRERIWHGFIDDTAASFCIPYVGVSRVLWGSDFPHIRSMGIDAGSAVYKLIDTLPPNEQDMVVGGNAAEVFRVGR